MRTHKAEPTKSAKRPPLAARAGSKKKASKRAASGAKKKVSAVAREARLVSHENDLFDEEEDFESPRRNPSQARPSEMEELDKPRRPKRSF